MRSEMYLIPAFCVRNQPFIKYLWLFFVAIDCHSNPIIIVFLPSLFFFSFFFALRWRQSKFIAQKKFAYRKKDMLMLQKKATGNGEIWNTLQKRALHRRSAGSFFFSSLISMPALIKIRRKKVVCAIGARAGS